MHGALSIIFVAFGISKQRKNFVPHKIDYNSTPMRDDGGAKFLETPDGAAKDPPDPSSTARAIEPTSPQDSTVSCRLSGSDMRCGTPWPGVHAGMASPRPDWLSGSGSMAGGASKSRRFAAVQSNLYPTPGTERMNRGAFGSGSILRRRRRDEHIDAAVIGFRATPGNGVTELVTRQYPARTVYEVRSAARSRRGSAALPCRCHRQRYGRPGRACSPRFLPAPGQFHRPCSLATPLAR